MHNHQHDLDLFFLGPKSEQRLFLTEVLQLVLNDHVFWRRNYYPKDPPAIPYKKVHGEQARHFREEFFTELFRLISDLKLDVPIFSPRYMAHMISETNLPSLVSYFATLLYNPNNVSSEASPVTIRYELQVGKQFAELFGYPVEEAFGHLTSGGTVANYESLWFNMAGRTLPVAIAMAGGEGSDETGPDALWRLMNVPLVDVQGRLNAYLGPDPEARFEQLRPHMMATLGQYDFARAVERHFRTDWINPVVVVPRTAHYSWSRALSLLGLGKQNVRRVDVDAEFRTIPEALGGVLETLRSERRPVWQIVSVVGTTEFGSVDPVDHLMDVRDRMADRGLYAPVHVDGAYGGYFMTMYRPGTADVDDVPPDAPPGDGIDESFRAISRTDSVTVDPHKAGYTPYGAGSIVIRHGFLKDLVAETAPYCLDRHDTTESESQRPQLGKFILEGSKPGAAAASVWFSHRLIPLNMDGYGRQLAILCRIARDMDTRVRDRVPEKSGILIRSLFRPHTNLLCLLAIPSKAGSLSRLNALSEALAVRFGVREVISIQSYDYLVSRTTVSVDMPNISEDPVLSALDQDAGEVAVLRLVFMNRWIQEEQENGTSYMDDFIDRLYVEAQRVWSEATAS